MERILLDVEIEAPAPTTDAGLYQELAFAQLALVGGGEVCVSFD